MAVGDLDNGNAAADDAATAADDDDDDDYITLTRTRITMSIY